MKNIYLKQFITIFCLAFMGLFSVNQTLAQCTISVSPTSASVCAGSSTTLTATFNTSSTRTYSIPLAQLINQGSFCDGTGVNRYNGCIAGNSGFSWTDIGSGTVTNVTVQFYVGIECAIGVHTSLLDGVAGPSYSTTIASCNCVNQTGGGEAVTLNFPNPVGYTVGGTNTFLTAASNCFGFTQHAALNNNYAIVTVTYTAGGTGSVLWNTGATTNSITVTPGSTTTYSVTGTTAGNTCSANTSATVTVNALPVVTASSNSPVNVGSALNLTSSGGTSYSWTGPNSFTSTAQNPTIATTSVANAGTYTVTATNAAGCSSKATTKVAINSGITNTGLPSTVNAAAAYSTRKLSPNYTGAALNARRSADNAQADIAFDANGTISNSSVATITATGTSGLTVGSTMPFSTFYGSGNAQVAVYYDQSGNGRNATQATANSQPFIVLAGAITTLNGKPAILFNGGPTLNVPFSSTLINAQGTFSAVQQQPSLQSGFQALISWSSGASLFGPGFGPLDGAGKFGLYTTFGSASYVNAGPVAANIPYVIEATWTGSGASVTTTRNGGAAVTGSLTNLLTANIANGTIGVDNGSTYGGYLSELIILPSALSATDRQSLEANQMAYYITPTLSSFTPTAAGSGQTITLTGTNLGASSAVSFGGTAATSFTVNSATSVSATVGAGATGNVSVTTPGGTATLGGFTYLTPATGLNFDGVNDLVNLNSSVGNVGTGDFTIEMNIRTTLANTYFFSKRAACGDDNFISMQAVNGHLSMEIDQGSGAVQYLSLTGTTSINNNAWHHIAVTRKSGVVSIYVDGALEASGTSTANVNNAYVATLGFSVCTNQNGSLYFAGDMDELRIWSRALCVSELTANKGCGLSNTGQTNLVALYHFDQGSINFSNTGITALTDNSGNGNNGTLANFALSGTASNWVAGTVSGTCAAFTIPNAAITGTTTLCSGATTTLANSIAGGSWTSSNTSVATINASGVVTAISSGTTTITYTNLCGGVSTTTFTVNNTPTPTIYASGATTFCAGGSVNLNVSALGNAMQLNGTQYAQSNNPALPVGNTSRTIEAWVKTTTSTNGVIANWGQPFTNQRSGLIIVNSRIYYVGENNDLQGNINISDGNWHHVAATFDGTTLKLYVDGTLDVSSAKSFSTSGTTLRIGQRSIGDAGSELYNGIMDELRIWNVARTQTELQNNRFAEIPGNSSGLVAYYKLNETSGLNLTDASVNNVTSTLTAAANWIPSNAPGSFSTYAWSPGGATTASIAATASGNYTVTVTANGCTATSAPMAVTVNPLPTITGTLVACAPTGRQLTGSGTPAATNPWTSSNTSIATVDNTGRVTAVAATGGSVVITYTDANGCSITANFTVPALPPTPTVSVVNNCDGTSVLTASGFTSYQWAISGGQITATGTSITVNTPGTYVVRSAGAQCVSAFASIAASPNTAPNAPTSGGDQSRCGAGNLTLSATPPAGATIDWYSAASGGTLLQSSSNTYIVSTATTVYAEARNSTTGCVSTTRTAVSSTINPLVTPTFTQVAAICAGASLSALPTTSDNGITGTWSPALNNTTTTTYTFTPTAGICASSTTMTITVNPLPVAAISGTNAICAGQSTTLTASGGGTYSWSTGETTASITVSPASNTNYTVTVTSASGCVSIATTNVTVNALPVVTISAGGSTALCTGGSVVLTASSGNSYLWSTGAVTQSITASAAGSYTVTVSNGTCSATSAATVVTLGTTPSAFTVSGGGSYCSGGAGSLVGLSGSQSNVNYQLLLNGTATGSPVAGTGSAISFGNQTVAGTYTVIASDANSGCTANMTGSAVVTISPLPTVNVVPDQTVCATNAISAVNFSGSIAGTTYSWTNSAPSIGLASSGTGNIAVFTTTNATNAPVTATITVTPSTNAGGTAYIPGITTGNVTVINTANNAVTATIAAGTNPYGAAVSPDGSKVYITNRGSSNVSVISTATNTVTATITAGSTPSGVALSPDGSKLYVSNEVSSNVMVYNTATNALLSTITVGNTPRSLLMNQDGTKLYSFNFGSNNISAISTATNTVSGTITIGNSPNGGALSPDGSRLLGVNYGAGTISVINTATSAVLTTVAVSSSTSNLWHAKYTPDGSRIYVTGRGVNLLYILDANTYAKLSTVTVTSPTGIDFTPDGTKAYLGSLGSSATVINTANNTVSATIATGGATYGIGNFIQGGTAAACTGASTSFSIIVNPKPTAVITADGPTTFCAGGSVTLTASAGTSYLWSNGATSQSITVNAAGSYSVTVTNASGCSTTSAATAVTVNPLPTPTITAGGATTICAGGSVTLTASAGSSYLWSTGATTQSISVNATGSYSVTVTNANGCSAASAATAVTVNPLPAATITAGGATTFCAGGSVTLTASAGSSYSWSNGANSQSITVNATGSYTVTVTNANGCSATSAATAITVNPLPTPTITTGSATTFCAGGSVTLTASAGSSYSWSTGATTQSISVNATGSYTVTVTNANGCSATSSATAVTVNPLPAATITVTGSAAICSGGSVPLSANAGTGYSYQWYKDGVLISGATGINYSASQTGSYTVVVTTANGCSATSAAQAVSANLFPSITNCPQTQYDQIYADANSCSAIFTYNLGFTGTPAPVVTYTFTGATTASGSGTGSGSAFNVGQTTVTVTATNICGSVSCSFVVTVVDRIAPNAITKNITVYLDASGHANVTAQDINNGSNDNCGPVTLSLQNKGTICAVATEGQNALLSAPTGTTITSIDFASYGTPTGSCGNFAFGFCHSSISQSVVQSYALNKNSATIPAVNGIFGDPCGGTVKRLYIQATYSGGNSQLNTFDCSKLGNNTVTLIVTDANGNVSTATAIVTVKDSTRPTITAPADVTLSTDYNSCGRYTGNGSMGSPVTSDNCSVTVTNNAPQYLPIGTTQIIWTATDNSGNSSTAVQTITVVDRQGPLVNAQDIYVNTDAGKCTAVVNFDLLATASDCTPGAKQITYSKQPGTEFAIGYTTVYVTATDVLGNVSNYQFNVFVRDAVPPVITTQGDMTVNNDHGQCGAIVSFTATATDCQNVTISYSKQPGTFFNIGVTPVTVTAIDQSGNQSTSTFNVTVLDKEPPVIINTPANITTIADNNACGAVVNFTAPTTTENCSLQTRTFSFSGAQETFVVPAGVTTIKVDMAGASGGKAMYSDYYGGYDYDANRPLGGRVQATLSVTPGQVLYLNVGGQGKFSTIPSTDGGAGGYNGGGSGSGDYYTICGGGGGATDIRTGSGLETRVIVAGGGGGVGYYNYGGNGGDLIGMDAYGYGYPAYGGTQDNGGMGGDYYGYYYGSDYTAFNGVFGFGGNASVIAIGGGGGGGWYGGGGGAYSNGAGGSSYTAPETVADVMHTQGFQDGDGVITFSWNGGGPAIVQTTGLPSGSSFPVGITTNTFVATDEAGNQSTTNFTVTVTDNQSPVLTVPSAIHVNNDANNCGATVTITAATATDNCAVASVTGVRSDALALTADYPIGTTTITWTAIDIHGNPATGTQTITVKDNQPPVITCLNDINVYATSAAGAIVNYISPVGTDNCSGAVTTRTGGLASGSTFPIGTTTITHMVKDAAGLTADCSFNVIVSGLAPVINCPENIVVSSSANTCGVNVNYLATETTGIPASTITYSLEPGSFFAVGTTTVTATATNAVGVSTCTFTVKVVDDILPTVITKNITVQLDANGAVNITPAVINNGSTDNCSIATYSLDKTSFDCRNVGANTVTLTVTDIHNNVSSATASVTVEDNVAPAVMTQNITVQLDANGAVSITPAQVNNGSTDNCSIASYRLDKTSFDCSNVGANTVILTVTDVNGNVSSKSAIVTVEDKVAPIVITQNITVQLDANGAVSISPAQINNGSTDNCSIATYSLDKTSFDCSNVGVNTVMLTVTDVNGNSSTAPALVTVEDKVAPTVITQNITVQLDANGAVSITPADINNGSTDNCSIATYSLDKTSFDCSNVGLNTVTLTVTDVNGNVSSKTAVVTVEDNVAPIVITQNITVQLDASGAVSITPAQINNGSTDNCSIATYSLDKSSFNCSNVGANTVILMVTDVNGNISSKSAIVTVEDKVAPIVITQNITVQLDANGAVSITPAQINNGSTDNCSIATYSLDKTSFDCSNVGVNTVMLTVTDVNGNSSTALATVTVEDKVAPTVITQNITVQLDASGAVSITPADVNNGSTDNCSIATYSLDKTSFDCSNVGANTVILTVTDVNGNVSSKPAVVTVEDKVAPIVITQNITVQLDASGAVSITPAQINNGSTDNCSIATYSLDKSSFNCSNVGTNTVILTVTDVNGNVSSKPAIVTVEDKVVPTVITKNITVQLNANGTAVIAPADVNNGSTDNCAIATYSLDKTSFNCSNVGLNTVTLTATDVNGNSSSATAVVTIEDHVPAVVLTNNITIQLSATGAASIMVADINNGSHDACGIASMVLSKTSFNCSNVGLNTITLTVTDVNGNVSSNTAVVTVKDTIPAVVLTKNITIQLNASGTTSIIPADVNNGSNDACGIASMSVSPNVFSCANVGNNTVTLTVTDVNGNVSSKTAVVTVQDKIAPVVITKPITVYLDGTGHISITAADVNNGSNDACGIAIMSVSANSFDCSKLGANTVTLTVTDVNGNTSTKTAVVTVQDKLGPVPTVSVLPTVTGQCSANIVIVNATCSDNCRCCRGGCHCHDNCRCHRNDNSWNNHSWNSWWWNNDDDDDDCDNDADDYNTYYMTTPTAMDNCSGLIKGTTTDPLHYNTQGTYTINWKFVDANGNVTIQPQTVIVNDNQAPIPWVSTLPTISGQCSVNLSLNSNWEWWDDDDDDNGYDISAPWAWDNCAGWIRATTASPLSYTTQGTYTIAWKFNDGHGNITTQNQTVIVKDNIAPKATVKNLPTVTGSCSATVTTVPTAKDNCAGMVNGTTTSPLTYTAQGTYTITWTYSDGNGNASTQTQTVIVKDNTAPVPMVTTLPTVKGECSVTVTSVPKANDNCKGVITATTTDPLTYTNEGTYTIHWSYNDGNGNITTQNQTVIINDVTAPVPQVATLPTLTGECSVTVTSVPKANDNCKGVITATTSDALTYNKQGTYTIRWSYNDGNGNTSTQNQTVVISDVTKPNITAPAAATVSCGTSTAPAVNATATDNCSTPTVTYSDVTSGNTITRTWKATDAAGNYSTATQTLTIVDNTAPTITDPRDVTVSCGTSTDPSVTGRATATDNCSTPTVSYTDVTSGYTITRTWTAKDASNNSASSIQVITIVDNTKPVIATLSNVTVNCGASTDPSATGTPTASDNCSGVTLGNTDVTSGNTITRTWKATDASGNYATSVQVITIGMPFTTSVTSVPTSNTYTGGVSTNLYLGYGAQSTTLQVGSLPSSGAPYTYAWSGTYTSKLSSTTASAPVFTPTGFGYYTFSVTVTNKYGCTASCSISICVTDVRVPGTNGAKIYVTHTPNGKNAVAQTLQVLLSQVSSHIGSSSCGSNGNDRLGSTDQSPCNTTIVTNTGVSSSSIAKETETVNTAGTEEDLKVTAMPNPSTTFFTLKIESRYQTPLELRVMDGRGRVVDAKSKIGANSTIQIGHNYSSGTYYAELIQGTQRKVVQLIKARG